MVKEKTPWRIALEYMITEEQRNQWYYVCNAISDKIDGDVVVEKEWHEIYPKCPMLCGYHWGQHSGTSCPDHDIEKSICEPI